MARPRFVLAPLITGRCWLVNVPSPQSVPEPRLLVGQQRIPSLPWTDGNSAAKVERPRGINWPTPLLLERDGRCEVVLQSPQELAAYMRYAPSQPRLPLEEVDLLLPALRDMAG